MKTVVEKVEYIMGIVNSNKSHNLKRGSIPLSLIGPSTEEDLQMVLFSLAETGIQGTIEGSQPGFPGTGSLNLLWG